MADDGAWFCVLTTGKGKSYRAESREMSGLVLRIKLNEWQGAYVKREG